MPRAKSIYSSRQALAPGAYDNPLADFLDALPVYISQYQQNKLKEKRYDDEKEYREARDAIADSRFSDAQDIEKARRIEEQKRYEAKKTRQEGLDADKKKLDNQKIVANSFKKGDPRYLTWLINEQTTDGTGENIAQLTNLKNSYERFGEDLDSLNKSVNVAGDLKGIANSQILVDEFMNKHKNDPNFTPQSAPYIQVLGYKNKLSARMAQVPGGFVAPKKWEETFGPEGRDGKILLESLDDQLEALINQKGVTTDFSEQKKLDVKIADLTNTKNKLSNNFRVDTKKTLKSKRRRVSPYLTGNFTDDKLGGFQSFQTPPFDPNIVEQPSITETEMADVSDQISKQLATQQEIVTNINKINESIPGLTTTTPTDTTSITNENITALTGDDAEAYNPNRVGLDPDDPSTVPASFLEPITDTDVADETPEVVDVATEGTGTSGLGGAIVDRLFPGQASASTVPDSVGGQVVGDLFGGDSGVDNKPVPTKGVEEEPIKVDLFKPKVETGTLTDRKKGMIESQNQLFAKNDPDFMKSTKIAEDIYTSNIRDVNGNRLDLLNFKDFDKKINAMRSRIRSIEDSPKSDPKSLMTNPKDKLQLKQLLLEQRQLVNDLNELQLKLNSTSEYFYFPHKDSSGKQTGRLTRSGTKAYKRAIDSVVKTIPKQLRFIDQIN